MVPETFAPGRVLSAGLERAIGAATLPWRLATWKYRPLPDFLLPGAQKSGTTSLFAHLCQHPEIEGPLRKGVYFFDRHHGRGDRWYRAQFPRLPRGRGKMVGEATPYYLCHPHAPERIHALIPQARLIVLLRDPTERAISHYFHEVRKGRETLPVGEAMRAEEERTGGEWARMVEDRGYRSRIHRSFSYKQRGLYLEQLERYWRHFDRAATLVLSSGELFSDPAATFHRAFSFLGVDPSFTVPEFRPMNVGTNRADVPADVRGDLDAFFAPHNRALFEALGEDFGWPTGEDAT